MIHLAMTAMSLMLAEPAAAAQPTVPAPAPAAKAEASPSRRYCVVDTIIGSRIPKKMCRTRAEWLTFDFDPLARP